MAKKTDYRYVSSETSEISMIAKKFGAPAPLLFYIQNEMAFNKGTVSKAVFRPGKVLRSKFYSVLKDMGYPPRFSR